jgi:hypothetical protein
MKQLVASVILTLASGVVAFAQADKNPCPEIIVIGPSSVINLGESAKLNVEINKEIEKYKIEYFWTVSGGKITRGQGTPEIEVATGSDDDDSNIAATVKLKGLPENCPDSGSESFVVVRHIGDRWFDTFGKLPRNDLYSRLDNLFVTIRLDPAAEGLIALEFDKAETRAKKIKRLNEILKHVNYRKLDKSRLKFLISEAGEEYTKLYIFPRGAKLTQVIDESEVPNVIKGEEIERKIKELFPQKKKSK